MEELYKIYSEKLYRLFRQIERKYKLNISQMRIIPEKDGCTYPCFVPLDIQDIDSYKWNRLKLGGDIFNMVCMYSSYYEKFDKDGISRSGGCAHRYVPRNLCRTCSFTINQADRFLFYITLEKLNSTSKEPNNKDIAQIEDAFRKVTYDVFKKEALTTITIKEVNIWE